MLPGSDCQDICIYKVAQYPHQLHAQSQGDVKKLMTDNRQGAVVRADLVLISTALEIALNKLLLNKIFQGYVLCYIHIHVYKSHK